MYLSATIFRRYVGYWFSVAYRHICRLTAQL